MNPDKLGELRLEKSNAHEKAREIVNQWLCGAEQPMATHQIDCLMQELAAALEAERKAGADEQEKRDANVLWKTKEIYDAVGYRRGLEDAAKIVKYWDIKSEAIAEIRQLGQK